MNWRYTNYIELKWIELRETTETISTSKRISSVEMCCWAHGPSPPWNCLAAFPHRKTIEWVAHVLTCLKCTCLYQIQFQASNSLFLLIATSLANTRLNHKWDVVWWPPIHFPVEEAWFPIVQSRLLGATNVYHKRLFVALSQSYQLYQMTYVKRQKFDKQASRKKMTLFTRCRQTTFFF